MTTEPILTDEEIIAIGHQSSAIESGENGYILPITFARDIEQAILQSPEIQAMWDDGFTDGVLLALQMMTANGDAGSHLHTELIEAAGLECVVRRAAQEGMTEMAGLDAPMPESVRAKINAAMEHKK